MGYIIKAPGFSNTVGFAIWNIDQKTCFNDLLLTQQLLDKQLGSCRFCAVFSVKESWRSDCGFLCGLRLLISTRDILFFAVCQFFPPWTIFWSKLLTKRVALMHRNMPSRDNFLLEKNQSKKNKTSFTLGSVHGTQVGVMSRKAFQYTCCLVEVVDILKRSSSSLISVENWLILLFIYSPQLIKLELQEVRSLTQVSAEIISRVFKW